jgi:cytochrome b561
VDTRLLAALAAGIVGGVILGFVSLRHTKFEATAQGHFYTPHTYIGLIVIALFVTRIAFRFMAIYLAPRAAAQPISPLSQYQRSPLTLAIFGVLIGYYIVFNLGILRSSRNSPPAVPEVLVDKS